MKSQRGSSLVFSFFERARQHYQELGIKDDETFIREKLGCGKDIKKGWYERGIKPVYYKILSYIEENQQLKKENQQLKQRIEKDVI